MANKNNLHRAVIAHLAAIGSKGGKIGGRSKSPAKIAACRATATKRKNLAELERENARLRGLLREASSALDSNLLSAWCSDLEERIAAELSDVPNAQAD